MPRPLPAILCSLTLVMAACGGDDGDKSASTAKEQTAGSSGGCKTVKAPPARPRPCTRRAPARVHGQPPSWRLSVQPARRKIMYVQRRRDFRGAVAAYERALSLTLQEPERRFLEGRLRELAD